VLAGRSGDYSLSGLTLLSLLSLVFGCPSFNFFWRDGKDFPHLALEIGKRYQRVIV